MFNEKTFANLMKALENGNGIDVPIASSIEVSGNIYGPFTNSVYKEQNHLLHAEVLAISTALKDLKLMDFKNKNAVLYSTVEPCCMCLAFASYTRVSKIVFYAEEKKFGGSARIFTLGSAFFRPELVYIEKDEVKSIMNNFFKEKR